MNTSMRPLTFVLAAALAASPAAWAAPEARISESVTAAPVRGISPADEAAISRAAVNVLNHIGGARKALARKDAAAARAALKQADSLLDIIEAALPTTRVRDQIKLAQSKLQFDETVDVQPNLVPLYASLDEIEDFAVVPLAKAHLDQARARIKAGDKPGAKKELEAVDAALLYQEADLPLSATRHFIHAALAQLARHKFSQADAQLQAAQDNIVYYSAFVDEPLVPAKANLARAQQNYLAGRTDMARADLARAGEQLERAAQRAEGAAKIDAQALSNDARALGQKIDKGGAAAERDFSLLWHRTRALAERAMDYTSIGWSRFRVGSELKKSMIEAKLYARYAEADALVGDNPVRAQSDLAEVGRYLEQARGVKEIAPATLQAIDALSKQLDALRQPGKALDAAALRTLNAGIAQAIRSL